MCFLVCIALAMLALILSGCPNGGKNGEKSPSSGAPGKPIVVFAGGSLGPALKDAATAYTGSANVRVEVSSGDDITLVARIEKGERCDVYFPSDPRVANSFVSSGRVKEGDVLPLIGERLAVVVRRADGAQKTREGQNAVEFLRGAGKVAVGDERATGSGLFASKALAFFGLDKPLGKNLVRLPAEKTILLFVKLGEADVGIAFSSDAMADPGIAIIDLLPPECTGGIRIPVVFLSGKKADLTGFTDFLAGPEGKKILSGYLLEIPQNVDENPSTEQAAAGDGKPSRT